jgi:hypothetical protein
VFHPFAEHRGNPDIHWDDPRHATVYHNGRIWKVREDEACDWLIFVTGRADPVHRVTSGGCSEAFRWIASRPPSWTAARRGRTP